MRVPQVFLGELIVCSVFLMIFKLLCFLISNDNKTVMFFLYRIYAAMPRHFLDQRELLFLRKCIYYAIKKLDINKTCKLIVYSKILDPVRHNRKAFYCVMHRNGRHENLPFVLDRVQHDT
jgi:hypothetical protein